jgi:hypothetical protein
MAVCNQDETNFESAVRRVLVETIAPAFYLYDVDSADFFRIKLPRQQQSGQFRLKNDSDFRLFGCHRYPDSTELRADDKTIYFSCGFGNPRRPYRVDTSFREHYASSKYCLGTSEDFRPLSAHEHEEIPHASSRHYLLCRSNLHPDAPVPRPRRMLSHRARTVSATIQ